MEDIRYCIEHKMNHMNGGDEKIKWLLAMKKAEQYMKADNRKTFTHRNIELFKKKINSIRRNKPKFKLYDDLTEIEHYAVRYFYYH